ncbi:SirB2 family protein [Pelagibius sp. 7325]|uniref:SirB2 family protein n=1 Tax=Pelagibius sp. 7325 TaxID=3131994 RepID=UPI0030ED803F
MNAFYQQIHLIHVVAVATSGTLFLIRGLALNLGAAWPRAAPLRYLSYTIDTVLLTAALMLTTIIEQYPFVDAWLTVKVGLLILYIFLGVIAFREGTARWFRWAAFGTALLTFGFIVSVARSHTPWGVFSGLAGG